MNSQINIQRANSAVRSFAYKALAALAADKARKKEDDRRALKFAALSLVIGAVLLPELALAAPWDGAGTWVLSMLNGGLTRSLAIVGVVGCGIAALLGKLSWQWAGYIVVGITLIFGGAAIVDAIIAAVA